MRARSTSTSTPPTSTRWCKVDVPMVGDCGGGAARRCCACWRATASRRTRLAPWWQRIARWRARATAWTSRRATMSILPQQLMASLAACAGRPRCDRLDRRGPAPDVGRAVPALRTAAALAHFGRRRHDGLRPAGGDRRADRAPRGARRLRERRRLGADEHPGALHRGAAPHAGEAGAVATTATWAWCASGRSSITATG